MSKSIRLHKDYGLNPTIPVCFFCGQPRNEIALLGATYKGEAPKEMIIDTEPCDDCKAGMAQGISLLGVTDQPVLPGQQPACTNDKDRPCYLTGTLTVITEDCARRLFNTETADSVIQARKCYLDDSVIKAILASAEGAE